VLLLSVHLRGFDLTLHFALRVILLQLPSSSVDLVSVLVKLLLLRRCYLLILGFLYDNILEKDLLTIDGSPSPLAMPAP